MALSSSLFTGTSGLINMGNNMQVISNNIANSNTVGFKKGTSAFSDALSQSIATQAGSGQVGRGMSIGEVARTFDQGSLESTGNITDLSIGGDGFFIVRDQSSDSEFYTRAGNFKFDESGQFVSPQGYVVQGWQLDTATGQDVGAIGDIVMKTFTCPPSKSTEITVISNLDATAESKTDVMANSWNGTATTTMDGSKYQYQTVVKVYDSLGSSHDVTIYYDKKSSTEWEYMVATDPADDKRALVQDTVGKGLLAKGTITFSPGSGDIADNGITMYRFNGRIGNLNTTGGEIKETDVHFKVINSDKMVEDGYNFGFTYDTTAPNKWVITVPTAPAAGVTAYGLPAPTATVLAGSSDEKILISLDGDAIADLEIHLDKQATPGDIINFDICGEKDIHVQGIVGDTYQADTADGNTTIQINDPTVITKDLTPVNIVWDPTVNGNKGMWVWGTMTVAAPIPPATVGVATVTPFPLLTGASPNQTQLTPDAITGTAPNLLYPKATLSGDKEKAIINLDGANNKEDIVFSFTNDLVNASSISFSLNGSNAWSKIEDDELEETGYFDFKTDFLGGDFGATESDIKLNMGAQYVNGNFTNDSMSTTQFAKKSSTVYQDADGYTAGSLEGVEIGEYGNITGVYSNGELIPLFRIGLADFRNNNGLLSAGGNLFSETNASGSAITNKPGENGLGTLSPNSLEMSNVDISEEFVRMITTQRGFQANSKTITTVDDMLNTVIGMKR